MADTTRRRRILVVEDEPLIAALITDVLQGLGHEVDAVGSGRAALERLEVQPYDLVVSDLRMPELDGPGLYAALEREHPELVGRIVFITGSALEPANERFLAETKVGWLAKPFGIPELLGFIERALARS